MTLREGELDAAEREVYTHTSQVTLASVFNFTADKSARTKPYITNFFLQVKREPKSRKDFFFHYLPYIHFGYNFLSPSTKRSIHLLNLVKTTRTRCLSHSIYAKQIPCFQITDMYHSTSATSMAPLLVTDQ